jgi:hypothetical protein
MRILQAAPASLRISKVTGQKSEEKFAMTMTFFYHSSNDLYYNASLVFSFGFRNPTIPIIEIVFIDNTILTVKSEDAQNFLTAIGYTGQSKESP